MHVAVQCIPPGDRARAGWRLDCVYCIARVSFPLNAADGSPCIYGSPIVPLLRIRFRILNLPPFLLVQVGVGALVLNAKGEMLVVQEKNGALKGRNIW